MNYWLIKSEASCYSIDDLKKDKKTSWTGVRNYQARNYMVRDMAYASTFKSPVTLAQIKFDPALAGMMVTQVGSRLSIQPGSKKHFEYIVKLAR